jgi:hypothetical protein
MSASISAKNRRRATRKAPRGKIEVACHKSAIELGPGLALELLDLSEVGMRLTLRSALSRGQEVLVTLEGPPQTRAMKLSGTVAWCLVGAEGNYVAGIQFYKPLLHSDLTRLT